MNPGSPYMLTQNALATRYRVAPRTIKRWADLGLIPVFIDPDTGTRRYPLAAIQRWETETGRNPS